MNNYLLLIFIFSNITFATTCRSLGLSNFSEDDIKEALNNCKQESKKDFVLYCNCINDSKKKYLPPASKKEYNEVLGQEYQKQMMKSLYSISSDISILTNKYRFNQQATTELSHSCSVNKV